MNKEDKKDLPVIRLSSPPKLYRLGEVCDLKNGLAFKSKDYVALSNTMSFRMSQIRPGGGVDLENNPTYLPDDYANKYQDYLLKEGDIVIAMTDMATETKILGVPTLVPKDKRNWLLNQRVGKFINFNTSRISTTYLRYILTSPQINNYYKNLGKGGLQINISKSDILNVPIPLPPLPEQQRIADKIEKLFTRSKKIKTNFDQVPKQLERLRKSILAAAFRGDLTKDWREMNPDVEIGTIKLKKENNKTILDDKIKDYDLFELPIKWKWNKISDVADVKGGKRLPKGESLVNYNTGFPYIKAGDLKFGTVQKEKLEFLLPKTREKIKRYIISKGDVYITNVGACIGDAGILPDDLDGANLTENALKICNHEGVYNKFLSSWLQSPIAQSFILQTILSGAQGKLALGRVEVFPIPLPPLAEQKEIVRRVEKLLANVDKLEAAYKQYSQKLITLNQSILAKAFRGELVPQDPNDEPASVLLERIKAEKGK